MSRVPAYSLKSSSCISRRDILRIGGFSATALAAAPFLAACGAGGGGGAGSTGSIKFMADTRPEFTALEKMNAGLKKAYGFDFSMLHLQETPLRSKTGLELSAPSTTLDAIMMDFLQIKPYADGKQLYALDNVLNDSKTFNKADFKKPFLDALTFDGKLYGVPLYQDCNILIYRADIFQKLGLDVPDTMEDLKSVAQEIQKWGKSSGVTGIAMRGQRGFGVNEWTWPCFLEAFGGSYLKDYPHDLHPVLDSPEAVHALTFYVDLLRTAGPKGVADYSYVEVQNDLTAGKTAMILDSATLGTRAEDPSVSKAAGKLAFAEVPKGPGGRHPGFYTWTVSVPAKAPDPKKGAQFASWMVSPAVAAKVGFSAPNQALQKVYTFDKYSGYPQAKTLLEVMDSSLAIANPDYRPRISIASDIGDIVSQAISSAISGQSTPAQALRAANAQATSALKKAKLI